MEHLAGYTPLRAHGERILGESGPVVLRPLVVLILPMLRRARGRAHLPARARDPRRRWRRDHPRLPPSGRRRPSTRHLGQGPRLHLHPRHRRLGRPRRAHHADGRRARLGHRSRPRREPTRAPHPHGRRRRGRHGRRLSDAARGGAAGGRDSLPRRLRSRGADSRRPGQRHRLLGRHHDLRRIDAVCAGATLSLHPQAPASLRAARGSRRRGRVDVSGGASRRPDVSRRVCRFRSGRARPRVASPSACSRCRSSSWSAATSARRGARWGSWAAGMAPPRWRSPAPTGCRAAEGRRVPAVLCAARSCSRPH